MMWILWSQPESECNTDDHIRDHAHWCVDHDAFHQSADDIGNLGHSSDFDDLDFRCDETFAEIFPGARGIFGKCEWSGRRDIAGIILSKGLIKKKMSFGSLMQPIINCMILHGNPSSFPE